MATLPGVHKVPDVTLKRGVMSADDGAFDFAAAPGQAAGGTFFDGRLLTADDLRRDQQTAADDGAVAGGFIAAEDWSASPSGDGLI